MCTDIWKLIGVNNEVGVKAEFKTVHTVAVSQMAANYTQFLHACLFLLTRTKNCLLLLFPDKIC